MHLSDNLKRIRREKGLNQDELSERSGVSKAQISRIEVGAQDNPTIKTTVALCAALGISLEELIFNKEDMHESMKYMLSAVDSLPANKKMVVKELIAAFVAQSTSDEIRKAQ